MNAWDEKNPTVQEQKVDQKKELKYLGQERGRRGQVLWEFNHATGLIVPATLIKAPSVFKLNAKNESIEIPGRLSLHMKKDCNYFWSLNHKNAVKKMKKAMEAYMASGKVIQNEEIDELIDQLVPETHPITDPDKTL